MLDPGRPDPISSDLIAHACADTPIRHGFFTRAGGTSNGIYRGLNVGLGSDDDRDNVIENRSRVCRWFTLPDDRLATLHQIHSTDVVVVDGIPSDERPKGDAMVTAAPGIVLGVLTADCGPVLFADPQAKVVAAAHAGWKGALYGIVEQTISAMERLGAERERIVACLGPSISGTNYETGPEFRQHFVETDPESAAYFSKPESNGHALFDLPRYTMLQLERSGVQSGRTGHCTYHDEGRFFSYRRTTHRREPDYGRQISAIGIVEGGRGDGPPF
jgi:YfiH family protein